MFIGFWQGRKIGKCFVGKIGGMGEKVYTLLVKLFYRLPS